MLHYPNAFMAASGLVCAASMIVIVAANLLRVVFDTPLAMVPGDPDLAMGDLAVGAAE